MAKTAKISKKRLRDNIALVKKPPYSIAIVKVIFMHRSFVYMKGQHLEPKLRVTAEKPPP